MRKIGIALALISSLLVAPIVAPSASAQDQSLKIESRNLYLGADVGVALNLIPDFAAAAQFMWSQVAANDFSKRAPLLAKEAIDNGVDVIGLQEATNWYCKKNAWSKKTVVFNFTEQFLAATKELGHEYVLAEKDGTRALNVGYSIPAVPFLTIVNDPHTFQPLFGQDKAACGFEIGDAIAIRKDLLGSIKKVGNSEYETTYSIVPTLMTIYRGYTWIDLEVAGSPVRIVSTHLESLWDSGKVPNSAKQADQLIADLSSTKIPTIVIGDFNADPRDPRKDVSVNPGGQPEASSACPEQVASPTLATALDSCNAYWKMRKAGFEEVGPDAQNPVNFTWGASALLAGPDIHRVDDAKKMGNSYGFTDRLDYIFYRNGIQPLSSTIIGNTWPQGANTWTCLNEEQVKNTHKLAKAMGITEPLASTCLATDHAGLVASVLIPAGVTASAPDLPAHAPFPIAFWQWVGIFLIAAIGGFIFYRRKRRAGKVEEE